ncbi:hypothetical protein GCM10010371_28090 [Streptomyces subrutilus]|uniref:Uncharacterized protein n=1 Tax=Streptomyces subrutilus TaxID=36818 RepID=A0A918QPH4_9ACTN|nr:hypothetical protein GCM10010371_28090 [Streptomyces subrutilus]
MAAEAEGAVDDDGPGPLQRRGQQVQAPLEHHRDVSGLASQSALSDNGARRARTTGSPAAREGGPAGGAGEAGAGPAGERRRAGPYVRARARGVFNGGRAAGEGRAPAGSRHFSATVATVNEPPRAPWAGSAHHPRMPVNHPNGRLRLTPVG